jgi:ATP-binding cassette subfamily B protein
MSPLRRFAAYYRPHRRLFMLDFGCAVLSGLLELAFPLAVMKSVFCLAARRTRLP